MSRQSQNTRSSAPPPKPEGFETISNSWPIYKPEDCGDFALQGYVLEHHHMPPAATGPWEVLVLIASATTTAVTRDGELVEVKPGERVAIAVTAQLRNFIPYAYSPDHMHELWIYPRGLIKAKVGSMWDYEVAVSRNTAPRSIPVLVDARDQVRQLSAPRRASVREVVDQREAFGPPVDYEPAAAARAGN